VQDLACSPDGRTLAGACGDAGVVFWGARSGAERARLAIPSREATRLTYHPDGRSLAVVLGGSTSGLALIDATAPRGRRAVTRGPSTPHAGVLPSRPRPGGSRHRGALPARLG